MTPTLLEGIVALVLIIVAWQIGVLVTPAIFRLLKQALREVDQASLDATAGEPASTAKEEEYESKHERN